MRSWLKSALFMLGIAGLIHRLRNRSVLTVAMFHRVLPPEDPRHAGANPTYTVTPAEFAQCLGFFRRFYNVVSIGQVQQAAAGAALPPCPLLITFDDGWQDNAAYALPLLEAQRLPALLFVATGHIGREEGFWQEEIFDRIAAGAPGDARGADAAVAALLERPVAEREARLAALPPRALPRRMANAAELHRMEHAGIAIGGHGHTHEPLTTLPDPRAEFAQCRASLAALDIGGARPAFSFPHGRWSPALVQTAQAEGFGLCFTSEAELVTLESLRGTGTAGRVSIELAGLRRAGGFDLPALAFSLLTRRHGPA